VGGTAGLKGQKRSLYAGGVRVPFIVRWPGVVADGAVDKTSVITAVDLLPTLAHAAGASLPAKYEPDGENILAALRGEPFTRSKAIYWVWPLSAEGGAAGSPNWPHLGYQSGDWKLLTNPAMQKTELYRVGEDWYEAHDLFSEYPEVATRLLEEMDELRSGFPVAPRADVLSSMREQN
jgi:N-acetylgalactosamine-6-sulfatase